MIRQKTWPPEGRGLFSLYIYIENLKIFLFYTRTLESQALSDQTCRLSQTAPCGCVSHTHARTHARTHAHTNTHTHTQCTERRTKGYEIYLRQINILTTTKRTQINTTIKTALELKWYNNYRERVTRTCLIRTR